MDDTTTPVTRFTRCRVCGSELDDLGLCRPCAAARSRRWYSETSSRASAERGLAAKLKRRFDAQERQAILDVVTQDQRGFCGCCFQDPTTSGLSLDWSLDQVNDDGLPMVRGALCRPCKIAVGRVVHPSKYRLDLRVLARVERYLDLPWRDPHDLLVRAGLMKPRRDVVGEMLAAEEEARMATTNETLAFLDSIGVKIPT